MLLLIVNDEFSNSDLDGRIRIFGFSFGSSNHQPGFSEELDWFFTGKDDFHRVVSGIFFSLVS